MVASILRAGSPGRACSQAIGASKKLHVASYTSDELSLFLEAFKASARHKGTISSFYELNHSGSALAKTVVYDCSHIDEQLNGPRRSITCSILHSARKETVVNTSYRGHPRDQSGRQGLVKRTVRKISSKNICIREVTCVYIVKIQLMRHRESVNLTEKTKIG